MGEENTNLNQPELLEDWTAFAGDYIKAEYVKEFPATFLVNSVNVTTEEGRLKLILEVEYLNRGWKFDLNKTNQAFIRSKGLMPRDLQDKKLICEKTKVRNPSTGNQVDSLIISDIE